MGFSEVKELTENLMKSTKYQNFALGKDKEAPWEEVKEGATVRERLNLPEDLEELSQKHIEPWPSQRFLYQIKREGSYHALGTVYTPLGTRWCHPRAELKRCCPYSENVSCIWAYMNRILQQNWSLPAPKVVRGLTEVLNECPWQER